MKEDLATMLRSRVGTAKVLAIYPRHSKFDGTFTDLVLKMRSEKPTEAFANTYFGEAKEFLETIKNYREQQLKKETKS